MDPTLAEPNRSVRRAASHDADGDPAVRDSAAQHTATDERRLGEFEPVLDHLKGIVASSKRLATIAIVRKKVKVKRIGALAGFGLALSVAFFFLVFGAIAITLVGAAGVLSSLLGATIWTGLALIGFTTLLAISLGGLLVWKKLTEQRLAEIRKSLGDSA